VKRVARPSVICGRDLGQDDAEEVVSGIDPELRGEGAAPVVAIEDWLLTTRVGFDQEAEAEAVFSAGGFLEAADLVSGHLVDGFGAEDVDVAERPFVHEHLDESAVVAGSGEEAEASAEVG